MRTARRYNVLALLAAFVASFVLLAAQPANAESTAESIQKATIQRLTFARAQSDDGIIRSTSVGDAQLGSTVEQLRDQLPSEYTISDLRPVTVDFDGHVIRNGSTVLFRAIVDPDTELVTVFIVSNSAYETVDGISAGDLISDVEEAYGSATLSWNEQNREFVTFDDQPEGLLFRTPGVAGVNVGTYEDGETSTTDYEEDGVVASIWVACDGSCPAVADVAADSETDDDSDAVETAATDTSDVSEAEAAADTTTTDDDDSSTSQPNDSGSSTEAQKSSSSAQSPTSLPKTGVDNAVMLVAVASMLTLGGACLMLGRWTDLGPRWLGSN